MRIENFKCADKCVAIIMYIYISKFLVEWKAPIVSVEGARAEVLSFWTLSLAFEDSN